MHKERKETIHVRIGKRSIYQHIKKISTMYVNNGQETHVQEKMYLKQRKEKDTCNPYYIPQKINTPPNKNVIY